MLCSANVNEEGEGTVHTLALPPKNIFSPNESFLTLEGSVPHAARDLRAVSDGHVGLKALVEGEGIQNHSIVERPHKTVDLLTEIVIS